MNIVEGAAGDLQPYRVVEVPLDDIAGWTVGHAIAHQSRRFFSIAGVQVRTLMGASANWDQPIVVQPEIGILGFAATTQDDQLQLLVQSKFEPGNSEALQLACTVQATPSNYMRVHGGASTPYLSLFTERAGAHVMVDQIQSEQGSWYLQKRNRNMVLSVPSPHSLDVVPGYEWMTLRKIGAMVRQSEQVNMNARSVLASIALEDLGHTDPLGGSDVVAADSTEAPEDRAVVDFISRLHRQLQVVPVDREVLLPILAWMHDEKSASSTEVTRVPLRALEGWTMNRMSISHHAGRHFEVIGARIERAGREVDAWMQPMLKPVAQGVVVLLVQEQHGVLCGLFTARNQPCLVDCVELAPSVQYSPASLGPDDPLPALSEYINGPQEWVRVDSVQTEDGGRFYKACTRYLVLDVPVDHRVEATPSQRWIPLAAVRDLLREGYRFNVESRSVLASLVW